MHLKIESTLHKREIRIPDIPAIHFVVITTLDTYKTIFTIGYIVPIWGYKFPNLHYFSKLGTCNFWVLFNRASDKIPNHNLGKIFPIRDIISQHGDHIPIWAYFLLVVYLKSLWCGTPFIVWSEVLSFLISGKKCVKILPCQENKDCILLGILKQRI